MLSKKLSDTGSVNLSEIAANPVGGMTREQAVKQLETLGEELADLQELLYAAGQNGLLVVLQGRDTSGKDGALKKVAGAMNPVGVRIASFKVPSPAELSHDFLWRIHRETPGRGDVVFFNRSHYEDVLVVRVHGLAPEAVWKKRYASINAFEELLHDSGIIIAKFYLHISKEEQEERLLAREAAPEKAWKLNPNDWKERTFWDDYTSAYEDALGRCATSYAPWYIVPSDRKWFRDVAIAEALVETLRPYRRGWEAKLAALSKTQRAAVDAFRRGETLDKKGA